MSNTAMPRPKPPDGWMVMQMVLDDNRYVHLCDHCTSMFERLMANVATVEPA